MGITNLKYLERFVGHIRCIILVLKDGIMEMSIFLFSNKLTV